MVTNAYGSATSSAATLTVTNVSNPPIIVQQPAGQTVIPGGTVNFTVSAVGASPLKYQWQKNDVNLINGGHYSGVATNKLVVTSVNDNDVANYRCVVTNTYGADISEEAELTISPGCTLVSFLNGGFEGGNSGGVGDGWTGYQRPPEPTTAWSIQTSGSPEAGSTKYQQIANTTSTGGGGVRQGIYGCVVGATYRISGWMRGNSQLYSTCAVKVSPAASTEWSSAIHLTPAQTYTGDTWTSFSGTVVATSTSMTLWLDGQTGGSAQNKAECFDSVTVTCVSPLPPLRFADIELLAGNQLQLAVTGPAGATVSILRSSNLVHWVPLTNLMNATGLVEFTDTSAPNIPQRFYRATSP